MTESTAPVVCILAHNEAANIQQTIHGILAGTREIRPRVRVYANGCTDDTHDVVKRVAEKNPEVELIELARASKPNAWNAAFHDNKDEILIFADADVDVGAGAVVAIHSTFKKCADAELVCCESWPDFRNSDWQQKLTGFLQIPIKQDFLIGHFYGIRRSAFMRYFQQQGLTGLPVGIAGDDAFLDQLVPRQRFVLVDVRVTYVPPLFADYFKYVARLRWQNEQIRQLNACIGRPDNVAASSGRLTTLGDKLRNNAGFGRLALGVVSTLLRQLFKTVTRSKIEMAYRRLGPVQEDGAWVLSSATRSDSVK